METSNVTRLPERRKAALIHLELPELPPGPFTVTVSDSAGVKMWEVQLDNIGNCPVDAAALGTGGPGMTHLVVNLLTGALRVFAGFVP